MLPLDERAQGLQVEVSTQDRARDRRPALRWIVIASGRVPPSPKERLNNGFMNSLEEFSTCCCCCWAQLRPIHMPYGPSNCVPQQHLDSDRS